MIHDTAVLTLTKKFGSKVDAMGVNEDEFFPVSTARFHGPRSSKKVTQPSKSLSFRRREADGPTLVFQVGLS